MKEKKNFVSILIIILLGLGFANDSKAENIPKLCPLNPAFEDYISHPRPNVPFDNGEHFFGYIPSPIPPEVHASSGGLSEANVIDSKYDMRDPDGNGDQADSFLTPVKNQGSCGSCWAFATYGSLESQIMEFLGLEKDFSENNLKHLHGFDFGPCGGGNLLMSTAYLSRYDGPISENDDPYDGSSSQYCIDCTPVRYVDNVIFLPVKSTVFDNDYIKQAILDHGGLYTAIYYCSASYNSSDYTYYYDGSNKVNHAVVIVGWDDDKVVTGTPNSGAFIVRNSWGSSWGDGGYFYVSYYDKQFAFSVLGYFDDKEESRVSFDKVYYYDKLGWTASLGYGPITWGANWFISDSDGILTTVGFYATYSYMSYEIYIYDEFNGSSFSDLRFSQAGTLMYGGWYTVKLDQEVAINKNDGFGVVIRFNTPGYNFPVPIEMPIAGYSSGATANSGESYISPDGTFWTDMTYNICIKAFSTYPDACEGNFDYDTNVDKDDLALFVAHFGQTDCASAGTCNGDFDEDGDVDGSDLAVFVEDFGRTDCPE